MSSILIGGKKIFFLSSTRFIICADSRAQNIQNIYDPDVIRTRSLLIWSQTRYRCATESF